MIKPVLCFIIFLITLNLLSNDTNKIKIMGRFEGETVKLPNQGKFNLFKANAAFSDSDENYGDAVGRGVRETNKNNKILNIYAVLIFETPNGSSMMARPNRTESDIKAGTGSYKILFANGVFKKYLGIIAKWNNYN